MAPTAYMHEDPDRAYMNNVPVERAPRISTWKRPWFCYVISVVQLGVFIGQCIHGWKLTGSPIEIHPSFNPMIGPSVYNSINMGARFIPCMKNIANITDVVTAWPCPNATTTAGLTACSLAELCGNGASEGVQEKQWWRFIVPIFLHAGIVHILFNLLVQVRLGGQVEMDIGPILFIPIYLAAGIGGYLFGGNFAGDGVTSTGASGSIFSIFSLSLLDLIYHWKQIQSPMRGLLVLLADVIISFVLGLLPGVDNFSHIGGFIIGILLGIALLKMPDALTRRVKEYQKVDIHMSHIGTEARPATSKSVGRPGMTLFKDRSPYWWAYWMVRAVCLTLTVVIFILLIKVCLPCFLVEDHAKQCRTFTTRMPLRVPGANICHAFPCPIGVRSGTSRPPPPQLKHIDQRSISDQQWPV